MSVAKEANLRVQTIPSVDTEGEDILVLIDHMVKGATSQRSQHDPKITYFKSDEIPVEFDEEEYPR